jgi:maltose O-acetyltransferase
MSVLDKNSKIYVAGHHGLVRGIIRNSIACYFFSFFSYLIYKGYILYKIKKYSSKSILGEGSRLYKEAEINNMQGSDKLQIGKNSHIRSELTIYPYGDGIKIGDNCYIGKNSVIRSGNKIEIGNSVLIGHDVTIIDSDSHEIDYIERDKSFKDMIKYGHPKNSGNVKTLPIIIDDNVWISYNVSILKGVHIGKGAIIGAGSVVTKDIPSFTVVAGNPAKPIRKLSTSK